MDLAGHLAPGVSHFGAVLFGAYVLSKFVEFGGFSRRGTVKRCWRTTESVELARCTSYRPSTLSLSPSCKKRVRHDLAERRFKGY